MYALEIIIKHIQYPNSVNKGDTLSLYVYNNINYKYKEVKN